MTITYLLRRIVYEPSTQAAYVQGSRLDEGCVDTVMKQTLS
jgi:hypothetical protein